MKILHVLERFAPLGGIETYVLDLLPLLEERGFINSVIYRQEHKSTPSGYGKPYYYVPVTNDPDSDLAKIIDITRQEQPSTIYLHDIYAPQLIKELGKIAPTIGYVHIFYPVCPGLGKLFRRGDKICERPYGLGCIPNIYLRRCATARDPRNVLKIMRTTEQYLSGYKTLPVVLVASNYMKELMVQNGIDKKRVKVLPYFIPIPKDSMQSTSVDQTRKDIMFAGRLEYEKGLPYLFEALRLIPSSHNLLIAGDGSLKNQYVDLVRAMGLEGRVKFLGWLSSDELSNYYARSAVAVMPTIMAEPFGKVGVEAMAFGRPVVAFDVGGIPDWLVNNHNGFLVPSRDINQLAGKLNILLSDPKLATNMGINWPSIC